MNKIHEMTTSYYDEKPVTQSQYSNQLRAIARKAKQLQVSKVISELESLLEIQLNEEQNYLSKTHYSNVKTLLTQQLSDTVSMLNKLKNF